MQLLAAGQSRRATAATAANAQSSRSHAVFAADVEAHNVAPDGLTRIRFSRLNLVDLAGSFTDVVVTFKKAWSSLECLRR